MVSSWKIALRPGPSLYALLIMGNIESVLSSSIAAVFFTGMIASALVWYGSLTTSLEIYGPTHYQ